MKNTNDLLLFLPQLLFFSSTSGYRPRDACLYLSLLSSFSFPASYSSHPSVFLFADLMAAVGVAIQSQAGCSNHRLLIGFIIRTEDLRWGRISWPRSVALKAVIPMRTHKSIQRCANVYKKKKNLIQMLLCSPCKCSAP